MKVFARSGNTNTVDTNSIATSIYLDTSQVDFEAGTLINGEITAGGEIKAGFSWNCGEDGIIDTRDGKQYATVQIGTQCWMKQNMNIGTRIPRGSNQETGCTAGTIQKYCYNNTDANCNTNHPNYPDGGLYQWAQAMCGSTVEGAQGICPAGWHIPTDAQQHTLDNYLKDTGQVCDSNRNEVWQCATAGDKMKPAGLCQGRTPCGTSGFEGNLAGYFSVDPNFGGFGGRNWTTFIWSSLQSGLQAWSRYLRLENTTIWRGARYPKSWSFSVRCLKD